MTQDAVVNKAIGNLKLLGVLDEYTAGIARPILHTLYSIAWEQGTRHYGQSNGKPIAYYDLLGNELGKFPNQLIAAKKIGYTDRTILRALKTGKKTRQGHYWKYLISLTESSPQI
jgi:hypothetical protein